MSLSIKVWVTFAYLCLGAIGAVNAEPRPPEVGVVETELDGTVYADQRGMTLYTWSNTKFTADTIPGKSGCNGDRYLKETVSASGISYYLPDPAHRLSCEEQWPPFRPRASDKPVGDWTIIVRKDGSKQWAYSGHPVYTCMLDRERGDVNGTYLGLWGWYNAPRSVIHVTDATPPGVSTYPTVYGPAFTAPGRTPSLSILYTRDASCETNCSAEMSKPFVAPALTSSRGDWTVVDGQNRMPQWAYKGKLVYTIDSKLPDMNTGAPDYPGWKPAIYRPLPARPAAITIHMTQVGPAYADALGRTLYIFDCGDETPDRLRCDVEGTSSALRLAICGGPEKCNEVWRPYVAATGAKSTSRTWTVVQVDKTTGAVLPEKARDGVAVWAYRGRPVYTYAYDDGPGDASGDGVHIYYRASFEMISVNWLFPGA